MPRIAFITNVIPSYRRAFFEGCMERFGSDFVVFCQDQIPGLNLRLIHNQLPQPVELVKFASLRGERLCWQFLPMTKIWSNYDIYVFYGNPRVISNVFWATLLKVFGKKVIIWGQAHSWTSGQLTEFIRLSWWRIFDFFFVYNDTEREFLLRKRFKDKRIVAMNNGLDQRRIENVKSCWTVTALANWQAKHNITGMTVLLSCARLDKKNRFDMVLNALQSLKDEQSNLRWVVIGDGLEAQALLAEAKKLHVDEMVIWLGSLYEETELAPWFLSAAIFLHPSSMGLSLLHAMGYGLPVITHDNPKTQGPEFAALKPNVNGLTYREGCQDDFTEKISLLLKDKLCRKSLGMGAIKVATECYNTDIMLHRFMQIIEMANSKARHTA